VQQDTNYYGVAGVGKTSLLLRYTNNEFSLQMLSTIGIEFKFKNIQLDSHPVRLQVTHSCSPYLLLFYILSRMCQ
jgi:hypothetical protein